MYTVYVLISKTTSKRYIGQTSDLKARVFAHNNGLSTYTKNRGPWMLVHTESFPTRSEAMLREKYLKTGKGREFLNNLTK